MARKLVCAGPLRVLCILFLFSVLLLILVSCGSRDEKEPSQSAYKREMLESRKHLFLASLTYSRMDSMKPGDASTFTASVGQVFDGSTYKPRQGRDKAYAGALVGARLHCTGEGVKCVPLSSERQNVLSKTDVGQWQWRVIPQKPGQVTVSLTVTAYYKNTDTPLLEKEPINQVVDVVNTPKTAAKDAKDSVDWIVGLLVSLAALPAGILAFLDLRKRRRTEAAD